MSYHTIIYDVADNILTLTLNRPEILNAFNADMGAEMINAFDRADADDEIRAIIVTGAGRAFCAGADLSSGAATFHSQDRKDPDTIEPDGGGILSLRIFDLKKPIIAAINGYALGGGLELAMSCDILIAAEHAMLGLPEARVGLVPGSGVQRLPRQIPLKIAMGMMLTGRHITAEEAHRLGLVNEVVPLAELMPTAERWANEILEVAPLSARAIKQMTMTGLDSPLDVALNRTYSEWQNAQASNDVIEGPKAFSEKRKPNWTGA